MNHRRRGRWTGVGEPAVEARLDALTADAARVVRERVEREGRLVTLAVIGGYGRGEGGVERVDGQFRPHNNLDLLLVTAGLTARARSQLARDLDRRLGEVGERTGVPIDLGVIDVRTLARARRHMLWYDVRGGHQTIAGDADFLRSQIRFSAGDIDPRDVRDLVVNRGTLLLIDELALARFAQGGAAEMPEYWKKRIVRHAMKAVVGYGDALLYAAGAYHWSYREKGRRIDRCRLVGPGLAELYREAIDFRFQPEYQAFLGVDLAAWHERLLAVLMPAHHRFLRALHGGAIAWERYPEACLWHSLGHSVRSLRDWARCARDAVRSRGQFPVSDMRSRALLTVTGPKDHLAAVFPAALYGVGRAHPIARGLLTDPTSSAVERQRSYLTLWAIHGDVNIPDDVRALCRPNAVEEMGTATPSRTERVASNGARAPMTTATTEAP